MSGHGRGRGRKRRTDDGWGQPGGYMQAKIDKLDNTGIAPIGIESNIFKGVAIFVNGYTVPSSDELKRLILAHGGAYHHYYSRTRVTHIIASNLPTSKISQLRDEKVVSARWITDCVAAKRLIPYQTYLLYSNRTKVGGDLLQCLQRNTAMTNTTDQSHAGSIKTVANSLCNEDDTTENINSANEAGSRSGFESDNDLDLFEDDETEMAADWSDNDQVADNDCQLMSVSEANRVVTNGKDFKSSNTDLISNIDRTSALQPTNNNVTYTTASLVVTSQCLLDSGSTTSIAVSATTILSSVIPTTFMSIVPSMQTISSSSVMAKTAKNPLFVSEFYNNSRLHHIATWGTEYKAYVSELQSRRGGDNEAVVFSGRERLRDLCVGGDAVIRDTGGNTRNVGVGGKVMKRQCRTVMHIDMDCFFVSVGLLSRPHLKDKAVAVTHSRGRGPVSADTMRTAPWEENDEDEKSDVESVASTKYNDALNSKAEISSCSYKAREAGVKNGMFFGPAKKICPDLIPIPYDFDEYKRVSQILYDTVASYTLDIEAVSCDELFIDCTDILSDTGATPNQFASLLRDEIWNKTNCTASAGLGSNMLLARLATRVAKPNGQYFVDPSTVCEFMRDKSVSDLPGVGYVLTKKLKSMGIHTCSELQGTSLALLQKQFGPKTGQVLYSHARGQDDRQFKMSIERKSVSAEINYGIRFVQWSEADVFLTQLGAEVQSRLQKVKKKGKVVTLKVKIRAEGAPKITSKFLGHGLCDNISRSSVLPTCTDSSDIIAQECQSLLRQMKVEVEDLRGMGIQITNLEAYDSTHNGSAAPVGCRSILDFTTVGRKNSVENTTSSLHSSTKLTLDSASCRDSASTAPRAVRSENNRSVVPQNADQPTSLYSVGGRKCLPPAPPLPVLPPLDELMEQSASNNLHAVPGDLFLPSSSQIDNDVLAELPEDMQQEILETLRRRDDKSRSSNIDQSEKGTTDSNPSSDRPGCSHWSDRKDGNGMKVVVRNKNDADLLYSELNSSFLAAMPNDIREELRQQYDKIKCDSGYALSTDSNSIATGQMMDNGGLHPLMRPENRISPKKSPNAKSPRKSPRNSPLMNGKTLKQSGKSPTKTSPLSFKIPLEKSVRQRKKPKRLQFGKIAQKNSEVSMNRQTNTSAVSSSTVSPIISNLPSLQDIAGSSKFSGTSQQDVARISGRSLRGTEISLAGLVTTDEIKPLLVDWTSASNEPESVDLETVISFLVRLVQARNLERVYTLLKYLLRLPKRETLSTSWTSGIQFVIDRTQAAIECLYGGPLKL